MPIARNQHKIRWAAINSFAPPVYRGTAPPSRATQRSWCTSRSGTDNLAPQTQTILEEKPSVAHMMKLNLAIASAFFVALCGAQHTELWTKFHDVAEWQGDWGSGADVEHLGRTCDAENQTAGCVVLFIADPHDAKNLHSVPLNEQNGFLNTQWYGAAWNLHGHGILGETLPRAPQDFQPVCYIVNVSGSIVMGYEEGGGDTLLPCPGTDNAVPFTEAQILAPNADLQDMCSQCYFSICSARRSRDPRLCGGPNEGGVTLGSSSDARDTVAQLYEQVGPAYHCHLTMTDENEACDYLQHQQHEADEGYAMDYGLMCGWDKVRYLNISFCDCTVAAGRHDRCSKNECVNMAYQGVVCGNCWGCSQRRSHDSIFVLPNAKNEYDGVCAHVRTAHTEVERNYSKMMCSKSLFCRDSDSWGSGCDFHCENFGIESETWIDPRCLEQETSAQRRLLHDDDADVSSSSDAPTIDLDTPLDWGLLHPGFSAIKATKFKNQRR